ncbi:MAG TPA: HlyD family efflux transporter periplasmic adaptor subunit [Stellaceae bacterium]|nr:HlyD family efflux transporter periplasmic adaptor subunit [Stellaceae bacterium]
MKHMTSPAETSEASPRSDRVPPEPTTSVPRPRRLNPQAIVAAVIFVAIIGLAIWYLARPEPLLVQGEVESTRIDIAARVSGRLAKLAVVRGQNVPAGATLLVIDNPELMAELREAQAEKTVADAELARINAGTRSEIIALRHAEVDRATAEVTLAQQTYDRTRQLAANKVASQSKLDEATDELTVAQRRLEQAKLAYQEAVRGFTAEEHEIAEANVTKAAAKIDTIKALVDQLTITAPVASEVYQIPVEEGEVVTPGVPLLSLVDLGDTWLGFSLREDLMAGLKQGDRIEVRIPALGNRRVTAEIRVIAAKGEYAGWRATRATGDFDLRTFAIRAYPVEKIDGLRPGMSVYTDWSQRAP